MLAWLLDDPQCRQVFERLAAAEVVVTSDQALIECDRVLRRAVTLGELSEAEASDRRAQLAAAAARWHVLRIAGEIVERARQPFPEEPIRTVEAIHLASATLARSAVAGLELLSLDERVCRNGRALGFGIVPG